MSVIFALVPGRVFVPTGSACSLISSFKDIAATFKMGNFYQDRGEVNFLQVLPLQR